jgi:hypothetical protein
MVQRGGEVQVLERGEELEKLERLERAGMVRRGTGDMRWVLEQKSLSLPGPSVLEALVADREDRF